MAEVIAAGIVFKREEMYDLYFLDEQGLEQEVIGAMFVKELPRDWLLFLSPKLRYRFRVRRNRMRISCKEHKKRI